MAVIAGIQPAALLRAGAGGRCCFWFSLVEEGSPAPMPLAQRFLVGVDRAVHETIGGEKIISPLETGASPPRARPRGPRRRRRSHTCDPIPPQTSVVHGPPARIRRKTASFNFRSTEPESSFECNLDGVLRPAPRRTSSGSCAGATSSRSRAIDPPETLTTRRRERSEGSFGELGRDTRRRYGFPEPDPLRQVMGGESAAAGKPSPEDRAATSRRSRRSLARKFCTGDAQTPSRRRERWCGVLDCPRECQGRGVKPEQQF